MNNPPSGPRTDRTAVLYVPRPDLGVVPAAAEREARDRAGARGLVLVDRTAGDEAEVDALLRSHRPDCGVYVLPLSDEGVPGRSWGPGALLSVGLTLVLADDRARESARDDLPPDRWAVLLPTGLHQAGPPDAVLRRREAHCEAYARRHGLGPVVQVLEDRHAYWTFVRSLQIGTVDPAATVVVVHPNALTGLSGEDRAYARWLGEGRVLRSAGAARDFRRYTVGLRFQRGAGNSGIVRPPDAVRSPEGDALGPLDALPDSGRAAGNVPGSAEPMDRPAGRSTARSTEHPGGQDGARGPHTSAPRRRVAVSDDDEDVLEARSVKVDRITSFDHYATAYQAGGAMVVGAQAAGGGTAGWGFSSPHSGDAGPAGRPSGVPLPHDGLFIRRSAAFGTRSVLGISDLIDSGVMVEQEDIRFDDFVASRTDQVPEPGAGEALAVSHGIAPVPGDSKAHEESTHFVEIALKAGAAGAPGTVAKAPLPVNFVFVVDTSISMRGEKLDTVKSALQEIYERLRPADSLGIVTFATGVSTLLQGTRKEDLAPERFAAIVAGMSADGGTDINLGLQYGIAEIGRQAAGGRTVNRLYLFSDGDPTSGETHWITIRKNAAARLRGDLTLSCFGFGSDARMTELSALAGTAGGHCTFVTRPEQVRTGLLEDLNRRDHLAAIDLQLRIDIDPAVTVWHLYGHDLVTEPRVRARVLRDADEAARTAREEYGTDPLPDLITDEKGIRIFAPDLAFGETYWVVLEVQVPDDWDPADGVGRATVQYVDTAARAGRSYEPELVGAAAPGRPAGGPVLSEETVVVHAVGLWTSEVTFHALDDLYDNDRHRAGQRLTQHAETLKKVHQAYPAQEFVDDRVTMEKLKMLAGALGTPVSYTDGGAVPAGALPLMAGAIRAMGDFGRVRSGFTAF